MMPHANHLPTVAVLGDPRLSPFRLLERLNSEASVTIAGKPDDFGPDIAQARVLFNWDRPGEEVYRVMQLAPDLQWIHTRNAGLDKFLLPEIVASPIPLTNGSGVFSAALAEFVVLGVLYFAKDVPRLLRAHRDHKWEWFDVDRAGGQTLGIVGHGDIGRAIAKRTKALGMRVLALRRDPAPRAGDEHVDHVYAAAELHTMLPECDYVVVAAPLTPETKHMIARGEFDLMKPTAVIMNVGRGPVIDERAMMEALAARRIRGGALDVFETEPLAPDHPMWDLDNVLISPHATDHTRDWLDNAVEFFIDQFGRWRSGQPLENVVDKHAGY